MARKKKIKPRGSSGAGRPRKEGVRHPAGKLVQKVEPNEKVVDLRRAMVGPKGRLGAAENPMDLALERGWLSEDLHKAGVMYANLWRRSHPKHHMASPLQEVPERYYDPRPISQMGSAEIAAAFEQILTDTRRVELSEPSMVQARERYAKYSRMMTADEQNEVFVCFCLASWPQWVLQRCAGHHDTPWERKRRLLVAGLTRISQRLAPSRKSA